MEFSAQIFQTDFGLPQKFGRLPLNFTKVRLNWYELIFHLIQIT